jgi:hypothetical protein
LKYFFDILHTSFVPARTITPPKQRLLRNTEYTLLAAHSSTISERG